MGLSPAPSRCPTAWIADSDNAQASYENGILKIKLAKREEAKPKQIKVGVVKTLEAGKKQAA